MKGSKRDYWLFATLFHICRIAGTFPLSWKFIDLSHVQSYGSLKGCFSVSALGVLFTAGNLVATIFCFLNVAPPQVFKVNIYLFIWLQSFLSAVLTLVLILTRHPGVLAECASTAFKIYTIPAKNTKPFPLLLFSILMVYPFFMMIYLFCWTFTLPFKTVMYLLNFNYVYTPLAALEVIISIFCFIAGRSFNDIKNKLVKLQKSQFKAESYVEFRKLLDNYVAVSNFVQTFSEYFSPHFLNSFLSFIVRMIVYSINSILLLRSKKRIAIISYGVHSIYLIFRLLFMCYFCQQVKEEMAENRIVIRRIRILWVGKISDDQEMLLDTYEELIKSTTVEFTACGLFPVNMQQVLSVIGLIITYGLVALQTK